MLSKKLDRIHTIANKPKPALQSWEKYFGKTTGTWLCSKYRDNNAKPVSKQSKFARITHSCAT